MRPKSIELETGRELVRIPILYEDRSVMAVDKPAGWLLVPFSWQKTQRNLQAAIVSAIAAGAFWAKSRNLKFLKPLHRLDGQTSGVLLLAKSPGAVMSYSELFESRRMEKRYLAVVHGRPKKREWVCRAPIGPDPKHFGRVRVDKKNGKEAETAFRVLATAPGRALVEARPLTGRTHQIRIHLLAAGHALVGDDLYGPETELENRRNQRTAQFPMALRAFSLAYFDPFLRKRVLIEAPAAEFLERFGFGEESESES